MAFDATNPSGATKIKDSDDEIRANFASIEAVLGNLVVNDRALPTEWTAANALKEWTDWTPNLTGGAELSGYDSARYYRIGDICFFNFAAVAKDITTAGTLKITLSFTCANLARFIPSAHINDGTDYLLTYASIAENSNVLNIFKTEAAETWAGTEENVTIRVTGFFEIA